MVYRRAVITSGSGQTATSSGTVSGSSSGGGGSSQLFTGGSGIVGRQPVRIGSFSLKYGDPAVDVTTEQRTVEQETIDNTIVVQTMGRKAQQITVNAIVADWETPIVDQLTEVGQLTLQTSRWAGTVVVTSTDTTFRREKDKDGAWLYDATIECLEAE